MKQILILIKTFATHIYTKLLPHNTEERFAKTAFLVTITGITILLCAIIFARLDTRSAASLSLVQPLIETIPQIEDEQISTGELVPDDFFSEEFISDDFFSDEFSFEEFLSDDYTTYEFGEIDNSELNVQGITRDSEGYLVRYNNDGDVLAILSSEKFSTALGDETFFVKNKYDDNFRVISRTVWQKTTDPEPHVVSRSLFFYTGNEKRIVSRSEVHFVQDQMLEITVNAFDGLPVRVTKSEKKESKENPDTLQLIPISEITYTYDPKRRVNEKTTRVFAQNSETASVLSTDKTEKIHYTYTDKADTPDVEIYHNDVLTTRVQYEANGTYTETRVLTADYSVKTHYEQNTFVEEIFLSNGKEIRRNP